jgi:hypothetical protein
MGQELSSPLANIIQKAAKLNATGEVAKEKERLDRRFKTADRKRKIILCDGSGSMKGYSGAHNMTREDTLKLALREVLLRHPDATIVVFGSLARVVSGPDEVCANQGGTNLAAALEFCATMNPSRTIIITDGEPTDGEINCIEQADKLSGRIDTIYCGLDNSPACTFLQKLSKIGSGRSHSSASYAVTELAEGICALLG